MKKQMNQEIKTKWLEALRSGEYKQGKGILKDDKDNYCCLGVLCQIHSKETNTEWGVNEGNNLFNYLNDSFALPNVVFNWANLESQSPMIGEISLIFSNDDLGYSFNQIADEIEKHL